MQSLIVSVPRQSCVLHSFPMLLCHSLFPRQTYLIITISSVLRGKLRTRYLFKNELMDLFSLVTVKFPLNLGAGEQVANPALAIDEFSAFHQYLRGELGSGLASWRGCGWSCSLWPVNKGIKPAVCFFPPRAPASLCLYFCDKARF